MVTPRTDPETIHEQPTEAETRGARKTTEIGSELGAVSPHQAEAEQTSITEADTSNSLKSKAIKYGAGVVAAMSLGGYLGAQVFGGERQSPEKSETTASIENNENSVSATPDTKEVDIPDSPEHYVSQATNRQEWIEDFKNNLSAFYQTGNINIFNYIYEGGAQTPPARWHINPNEGSGEENHYELSVYRVRDITDPQETSWNLNDNLEDTTLEVSIELFDKQSQLTQYHHYRVGYALTNKNIDGKNGVVIHRATFYNQETTFQADFPDF